MPAQPRSGPRPAPLDEYSIELTGDQTNMSANNAFVVGGSGGIGAAVARRLAEDGKRVYIGYNQGIERAEAICESLPGRGHELVQISIDDSRSIEAAVGRIAGDNKAGLEILVNCAGFTQPIRHADLDALDDALFDAIMAANVRGPFSLIRSFRHLLAASGAGIIVNISSISGFTGSGSNVAYCASKAALDTMTMSLARVLGPAIRVMTVSPGAVATNFVAGRDRAALESLAAATPLKVVVDPEDVAEAVFACLRLRASTGTGIVVDGGRFLV